MNARPMLVSILVPSRRIWQLESLLNSLVENTHDLSQIEVIVKYDDDQPEYAAFIEKWRTEHHLNIQAVHSPRLFGFFTMWVNMQLMWRLVSPQSYFVLAVTDEGRFTYPGWDTMVSQYKNYYPDHIFRLRLSVSRYVNYYNLNQVMMLPDCFPIFTRRWLEITNGFGDCMGSDAFQQSVAFHLGRGIGAFHLCFQRKSHFRDLVIHERLLGGIDTFTQDLKPDEQVARSRLLLAEWKRMVSNRAQTTHCKLARRILLEIEAHQRGLKEYSIQEVRAKKVLGLFEINNPEPLMVLSYHVPHWYTARAWWQFTSVQVRESLGRFPPVRIALSLYHARNRIYRSLRRRLVKMLESMGFSAIDLPENIAGVPTYPKGFGTEKPTVISEDQINLKGPLFTMDKKGWFSATPYLLRQLKIAKYVTTNDKELNRWIQIAYLSDRLPAEAQSLSQPPPTQSAEWVTQ